MPDYLAKYRIESYYYECMTFMPDETRYDQLRFDAPNSEEAWKKATEYKKTIAADLFHPTITLEQLLEVSEVKKPVPLGTQLDLELMFTKNNISRGD